MPLHAAAETVARQQVCRFSRQLPAERSSPPPVAGTTLRRKIAQLAPATAASADWHTSCIGIHNAFARPTDPAPSDHSRSITTGERSSHAEITKLQLNFANINGGSTSNGGILEETWLNYRFLDGVQVRFGQDKVQFGREFITSSAYQQFVDQSVVTTAFVPGYDTGLMVHGKLAGGLAIYNIGGYGGLGQNTFRTTSDNAFTARLMLNPLGELKYSESDVEYSEKPLVSLAGNFFRDTVNATEQNGATVTNNQLSFNARGRGWFAVGNPLFLPARQIAGSESVDYNTAGVDAAFKWRGFSAQGEYFFARASGQASGNVAKAEGFYLQTGYFLIPRHLELAARYSYLDPNRDLGHDLWTETTGCVSWYVSGHNLKVQSDYTRIHRQQAIASTAGSHPTDDDQVRIQAQLIF